MLDEEDKAVVRLEIRQYFDYFLEKVYPKMLKAHVDGCPHGKKVSKFKWILVGVGITLAVLVPTVGKTLLGFFRGL